MLSSRNPLAVKWYMLIVQGLAFFALYYAVFRAAIRAFDLRTPGREDDEPAAESGATIPAAPSDLAGLAQHYLAAVGGHANVVQIDACITRLRLTLNATTRVDEAAARQLGASGVIRLDERNVQIIVGPQAERIAQAMRDINAPHAQASQPAQPTPASTPSVEPLAERADAFIAALGGAANLTLIDACISRLRLTVADPQRINSTALRQLGASGVVTLGAQNVQVIVGSEAEALAAAMRRRIAPNF